MSRGPTAGPVLGLAFEGGVIIAADTQVSYGTLARFKNCEKIKVVNNRTIVGASGDYADYQYLIGVIEQKAIDDKQWNDGHQLSPKSLHSWITRVAYNRRSKFEPLDNTWIVGGLQKNETTHELEPFLGYVDKLGTAYKSHIVSTGFGQYLATPLFRDIIENKDHLPSEEEAKETVDKCMKVLFYRYAQALPRYQMVIVKADGVTQTFHDTKGDWQVASFANAY